jgi:hypothetical protein
LEAILAVTSANGAPVAPASISGTGTLCSDAGAQTYSVAAVANATTYTWTVPTGWTISAGAGTNTITVTPGAAGQNGDISVTAGNDCGTSTATILTVVVNQVPTVTAGNDTTVCVNQLPLSVTASGNATAYSWSNGSSTATTSITAAGTFTVTGTLNGCTASDAIVITTDPCAGIEENDNFFVSLYPNPTNGFMTIETSITEKVDFSIYAIDGKFIGSGSLTNGTTSVDATGFAPGKYFIHVGLKVLTFEVMH